MEVSPEELEHLLKFASQFKSIKLYLGVCNKCHEEFEIRNFTATIAWSDEDRWVMWPTHYKICPRCHSPFGFFVISKKGSMDLAEAMDPNCLPILKSWMEFD